MEEPKAVDDIPILLALLIQMRIPEIIDNLYQPHGHRKGLSVGWLITIFLTYIISTGQHTMVHVREWVSKRQNILERLTGQEISETDFTDDRLADGLRYVSNDKLWQDLEEDVSQQTIKVYDLDVEIVRLDATVGACYHDPEKCDLFRKGHKNDNQLKIMMGTLDPLGMPIASDVVPGNKADDPLYIPAYERIHQTLGKSGLLYVGDTKMSALETRATIVLGQDNYLMPLSMTGEVPVLLAEQLSLLANGQIELTAVYRPEKDDEEPELLAEGFEIERQQVAVIDGKRVEWTEKLYIVLSPTYAKVQTKAFDKRIDQAEKKLKGLTPPPGRGKRQFKDETELRLEIDKVLSRYQAENYFDITLERQETTKEIRAYGDKPARTETTVRYQILLTRKQEAIEQDRLLLGWRIYATNNQNLNLTTVTLTYRQQIVAEKSFAYLKGKVLAMLPLYVQVSEHVKGMVHLLTLALRVMIILEFLVRQSLAEQNDQLSGIYAGNPKRKTAKPTAHLLLLAFADIYLQTLYLDGQVVYQHITPLNPVQRRILELLNLPTSLYEDLIKPDYSLPLPHFQPSHIDSG